MFPQRRRRTALALELPIMFRVGTIGILCNGKGNDDNVQRKNLSGVRQADL